MLKRFSEMLWFARQRMIDTMNMFRHSRRCITRPGDKC
jgi:hypothetical protein